jgi:Cu/Ag efflux pump CusA
MAPNPIEIKLFSTDLQWLEKTAPRVVDRIAMLRDLPIRTPAGSMVRLSQVADVHAVPSQVELDREDLRQDVIVSARLEGADLGTAMREIQARLGKGTCLPPGSVEYGGLYRQQQASFPNLRPVLMTSLAAALGMLPLACGVGTGAQMLRPLGIAVISALFFSVALSLIATPVLYDLMIRNHLRFLKFHRRGES